MAVLTRSARAAAQRIPASPRRSDRIAFREYEAYIRRMIDSYDSLKNDPNQYPIVVTRSLLNIMNDSQNIENRKIIVYMLFQFLSTHTFLIVMYDRFREAVRIKITEIMNELNTDTHSVNTDKVRKSLMSVKTILEDL